MKQTVKFLTFLLALCPLSLFAQPLAQVVFVSADGAEVESGGAKVSVQAGQALTSATTLTSGEATVILSLCDGSLVTVYPQTMLVLDSLEAGVVSMTIIYGEILGDNGGNCEMTVGTKAGDATVSDGVFGVLLNDNGEDGWTLQVRNLDGTVNFVGRPDLDTSATIVTLLEPNKVVSVPPGEEFIVRGIYDPDSGVFALAQEGVALAMISEFSSGFMAEEVNFMNAAMEEWEQEESEDSPPPEEIEIPYEDFDVASEKG